MILIQTLYHSIRELCRCPHVTKKISVFVAVITVLYVASLMCANRMVENMTLTFLLRWLWLPLSVLFLVLRHGEVIKRHKLKKFFIRLRFEGYDGRTPDYIWTIPFNHYLKKIRFKSRISSCKWEKIVPDIEMFMKKKIYKIENSKEDITNMDMYVIEEILPDYIPWRDEFMVDGRRFAIGEGYMGTVIWDVASLAHGIVAGATGGGKTALLRCIIHQAILKNFNVSVFDFKQGGDFVQSEQEYRKYKDLEDEYGPIVISEPEEARQLLFILTQEIKSRLQHFKEAGVTNIDEFNSLGGLQFVPWLLVIDEAAEIFDVKPRDKTEKELYTEIDQNLRTLARISRAAGVHILMGIIRPSHEVLDGQIKNNLLWRACGYFADSAASKIVLENDRATELPPNMKGRFIIGEDEVQAYYLPLPNEHTDS